MASLIRLLWNWISLFNENGTQWLLPRKINLMIFSLNMRVRTKCVTVVGESLFYPKIVLATGEWNSSQYNRRSLVTKSSWSSPKTTTN